jgi:hypothetical protein
MYFLSDKHIQTFFNLTFPGANSVANAWLRLTTGFPTPAQQFLNFCKSFTDVRKVTSKKGWQITFRVIKRDRTVMIWNITEDVFLNNFDPKMVKGKFAFNHPMFPNCIICHLSMSSKINPTFIKSVNMIHIMKPIKDLDRSQWLIQRLQPGLSSVFRVLFARRHYVLSNEHFDEN